LVQETWNTLTVKITNFPIQNLQAHLNNHNSIQSSRVLGLIQRNMNVGLVQDDREKKECEITIFQAILGACATDPRQAGGAQNSVVSTTLAGIKLQTPWANGTAKNPRCTSANVASVTV